MRALRSTEAKIYTTAAVHSDTIVVPVTTLQKLDYLAAESRRLAEENQALHDEFEALRQAHFPREQSVAYCQRVFEYQALLENHRIAMEWTLYPPCGQVLAVQPRDARRAGTPVRPMTSLTAAW